MQKIKVRKIGNSLGIILPKESGVTEGTELDYKKNGSIIELNLEDADKAHDRNLIEKSFEDFKYDKYYTEDQVAEKFAKYGWTK
ncbi:hypothetical protein LOOC260_120220 [Paucilactobacillus hokkaidonensis JCM 18461]|uniref:AbrB family transcriptional regulator n=2 Tax=Paucilactobacillus hokkaidonensis TaxID=1193095 RepID=A0A0A1GZU8_9LACO|nr:AbrB family transcriptional regulator [Paucilactobacillus hokkaidonensis]KRO11108.1 hypothetical protein IV59_GL000860 [Paucilactobacillus hokkaidonensis]BAP86528.1 hypothetical protein LOOC260_120220 [Paucilactobacillus hokkaidonensis JCM 18461]